MYKGNMYDFCEKVSVYLRREFECSLVFGKAEGGYYFVAFFGPETVSSIGYLVYDTEDFEQQIYDYVNNELEDVQEEYDGFPDEPDEVLGDEV